MSKVKEKTKTTMWLGIMFGWVGLFSFVVSGVWMVLDPGVITGLGEKKIILAFTHMVTIGWIGSVLFAVGYSLGPALSGSKLVSIGQGWVHGVLHVFGLATMVSGVVLENEVIRGVGVLMLCVGLLVGGMDYFRTASKKSIWTVANLTFQSAIFWFILSAVLAIATLAERKLELFGGFEEGLLVLHTYAAMVGALGQALLGGSLYLLPKFEGVEGDLTKSGTGGWVGWIGLNMGLFGFFPALLSGAQWMFYVAAIMTIVGFIGYALEIVRLLMLGKGQGGWATLSHITGIFLLIGLMTVMVGVGIVYGFSSVDTLREWILIGVQLALFGPFALSVIGIGQRLLPEAIWKLRFEDWAKLTKVPSLKSLEQKGAWCPAYLCLLVGWLYLAYGQLLENSGAVQVGGTLILASAIWLIVGIAPAIQRVLLGVRVEDVNIQEIVDKNK